MYNAIYMIWQVTYGNGQQRRLTFPAFLVSFEEAVTATATTTRAIATTTTRAFAAAASLLTATTAEGFVHFYICRTERLSRNLLIQLNNFY